VSTYAGELSVGEGLEVVVALVTPLEALLDGQFRLFFHVDRLVLDEVVVHLSQLFLSIIEYHSRQDSTFVVLHASNRNIMLAGKRSVSLIDVDLIYYGVFGLPRLAGWVRWHSVVFVFL
jgi:hypothetical protein